MEHSSQPSQNSAIVVRSPVLPEHNRHQPYGLEAYGPDNEDNGVIEYWRIIRRYRRSIALFCFCGLLLGLLITIPAKRVYRASTTLEVLNLNDDFMNLRQSSPVNTNTDNYETSEEDTQVRLLQGAALLKRVFAKLDDGIALTASELPQPQSEWRSLFDGSTGEDLTPKEKLLLQAAKSLKVSVTTRTRVIELSVDSVDPKLARDFANTITSEFIQSNLEGRWESAHKTGAWLSSELEDTKTRLRKSEDALQKYAGESGLIFTDETTNVATEKLQQIQAELSAASVDRIAKQSRFELANTSPASSLADVLSDVALRETQAKITDLKRQIADLGAVFNPEYPKIQRLQAELDSLQTAFDKDREDILRRVANDYHESVRKEHLLAEEYARQTREVTGQDEKSIQYNILKRDVESNRQLYDTMLQQMKQSSVASALRASNVRVVDSAEVNPRPIFPNPRINASLGLISGLLLGISFALIRERADRTIQQPGQTKLWINLPELGAVPTAALSKRKHHYLGRKTTADLRNGNSKRVAGRPATVGLSNMEPTVMSEAFRSILTSILIGRDETALPRVIVVTSSSAGDGKSTVVSNLGIALAGLQRRALLIDADLRRPRLQVFFGSSNDRGLSDLLILPSVTEETIVQCIQETHTPSVHLLSSGPPVSGVANLLYSPTMKQILSITRTLYDLVIIDTPPMLQMTDARLVGKLADAVILVARAGKTTRDALKAMNERLMEDGSMVLGMVLNDWNPRESQNGYYGYYGQDYYSSYEIRRATSRTDL